MMSDNSKNNDVNKCKDCIQPCICEDGKICYNNEKCCYLQPKDVSIVQVNDKDLIQIITDYKNIYLTAIQPHINTSGYTIESSSIQRPNDTLYIKESGLYYIYLSLKYSFKFNDNAKTGDLFKFKFIAKGNDEEIFNINNTIVIPNIEDESEEINNTIQSCKLEVINEDLPYRINFALSEFPFDLVVLNQIIIADLNLIVKKMI